MQAIPTNVSLPGREVSLAGGKETTTSWESRAINPMIAGGEPR